MKRWFLSVMAWISQTINLLVLFGHHDMTVSARCYINRDKFIWGTAYKALNKIFYVILKQKNHCKVSFDEDVKYAKEILNLRGEKHATR